MRHPLSGAVYQLGDDGVLVQDRDRAGVYDSSGRWLSGDRFWVCPHLCRWIGDGPRGPERLSNHRRFRGVDPA